MWQREGLPKKHVANGRVTYETWQREGLLMKRGKGKGYMKHGTKGRVTYETCGKGKGYL